MLTFRQRLKRFLCSHPMEMDGIVRFEEEAIQDETHKAIRTRAVHHCFKCGKTYKGNWWVR